LGVGEHLVGAGDVLEPVLGALTGRHVGVQLTGELAVGLLDLVRRGIAADAEHLVVVAAHVSLSAVASRWSGKSRSGSGCAGLRLHPLIRRGSGTGTVPRPGPRRSSPRSPSG